MAGSNSDHQRHRPTDPVFKKGTEVEVSSDEDGFVGAWYAATIIQPPSSKRKKAAVEYKQLLSEDGPSPTPLTELVNPDFIRPLPPPTPNDPVFEEGDAVDARYQDGWWNGVVVKLVDCSRARVFFHNPPDVMEFDFSDLRPHFDWVDGSWIRPEKQPISGSVFRSGTEVEVNTDKWNMHYAWCPAVFVKENEDGTFLVKCWSSKNGDESEECRTTNVDVCNIRPFPPCYVVKYYELLEKVDAEYGTGWRPGLITKILAGGRFNIFFKESDENKELDESQLRPHADWLDGKWISKHKEEVTVSSNQVKVSDAEKGIGETQEDVQCERSIVPEDATSTVTEIGSERILMEQQTDSREKASSNCTLPRKNKRKLAETIGNNTPSNTPKNLKERDALDTLVLRIATESVRMTNETTTEELPGDLASYETLRNFRKAADQNQSVAIPVSITPAEMVKTKHHKGITFDIQKVNIASSKGRPAESSLGGAKASSSVDCGLEVITCEDFYKVVNKRRIGEKPIILGLPANRMNTSGHADISSPFPKRKPPKIMMIQNLSDLPGHKSLDINQLHVPTTRRRSCKRRRRERLCKSMIIRLGVPEAGKESHRGVNMISEEVENDITSDSALPTSKGEPQVYESANQDKIHETNGMNKDIEMSVSEVSKSVADDDQPLSTWIGGSHALITHEKPRSSSGKSVNGLDLYGEKGGDAEDEIVPFLGDSLPFVKRSRLWNTIESMEVFKVLPQKPHFSPLTECKEELREGSAIGMMVNFAGLCDKILSLKFDDARSTFQSALESLLDLEKYGFDVSLPRNRINGLQKLVTSHVEYLIKSKDAEMKFMELKDKKAELSEKMNGIKKKIIELSKELGASKSEMEANNLKSDKLASRIDTMKEHINIARSGFEKLARSPFKPTP